VVGSGPSTPDKPGAGVDAPPGAGVDPPGAGTAAQSTFFNFESVFSVAHVVSVQLHW